jgi:hypothetical protein
VAVSPEEIGLCGCWQVLVVQRERTLLGSKAPPPSVELGYYATSLSHQEMGDQELLKIVRDHWAAIENGSHYRRDVSLGEDASRVAARGAAQVIAALRNLAVGIYELEKEHGGTQIKQLKAWCRRLTGSKALKLILQS